MLFLYNTLSRAKEQFTPQGKTVSLYTCGPTVYNYAHIGNLRTYVFEDILKRTLKYNGYSVKHVMNITDVGHLTSDADEGEDKMEKGAAREKKSVWEIAKSYTDAFIKDLADLDILEPDIWCKATDHIREQILWIEKLEQKGYTYVTSDGVYFDTSKFPAYGALTKQKLSELKEGARVEKNKEKRNPTDFVLWKFSPKDKQRQMEWESPWGTGFPGWHIECSVMSMKYLGETIDIHCGGVDHIPVHHTNEIAQAEAVTGKPFVKIWMHGEFLAIDPLASVTLTNNTYVCPYCGEKNLISSKKEYLTEDQGDGILLKVRCKKCNKVFSGMIKMAKSGENFITLQTLKEKGIQPLAYRYFCLGTHYRKRLNFSWEALQAAQNGLENLSALAANLGEPKIGCAEFEQKFMDAINDDLNMPQARAVVWDMLKSDNPDSAKKASLLKFDTVLGLRLADAKPIEVPENIQELMRKREELRSQKNWDEADRIRDEISKKGFRIDDTPAGPVVKR